MLTSDNKCYTLMQTMWSFYPSYAVSMVDFNKLLDGALNLLNMNAIEHTWRYFSSLVLKLHSSRNLPEIHYLLEGSFISDVFS